MTSKQLRPGESPADLPDDLDQNPGIGQSKGLFAREDGDDAELIEGDNTVEGDRDNDAGPGGGVRTDTGRDH